MKKITFVMTALLSLVCTAAFAQLSSTGTGYYRVLNYGTNRYITLHDNKGSVKKEGDNIIADMGAVEMIKGLSNVASDPGSVLYLKLKAGSRRDYDLCAQGTALSKFSSGRYMHIEEIEGGLGGYKDVYQASFYAQSGDLGATITIGDDLDKGLSTGAPVMNTFWRIIPISSSNYFGVDAKLSCDGKYYTTLFTEFPYQLSSGVKAFYVTKITNDGKAQLQEIKNKVPGKTPVILECSSSSASKNILTPLEETLDPVSGNLLKGVYFDMNKTVAGYSHVNQTVFDPQTMRILNLNEGMVRFTNKNGTSYIKANTVYLSVKSSANAIIPLSILEAPEEPVTITAKSYTIKYGDNMPKFEYTAEGADLLGEPAITCEATRQSPVGTYTIKVSQGTLKNKKVTFVDGTLTIEKYDMWIIPEDKWKIQGTENPELTWAHTPLRNNEDRTVLTKQPVLTTTATKDSPVGYYPITASGAEAQNYNIYYQDGSLEVREEETETVVLKAKSYEITYGEPLPDFSYTKQGDADLGGSPVISCEATENSHVGTYKINISRGSITYNHVEYQSGTLTIKKAPLKISAGEYTIHQGEALPAFTASFDGFVKNQDKSVLTKQPEIKTTATSNSAPGTYDVTVSGAEAQDYEISYVNGKLTILAPEEQEVTITAKSYVIKYGDAIPTFEYDAVGETLKGKPAITCEATSKSPVGTYPIVISKGTVENTKVTYVNGTLTIEKAPLKISVGEYTKKQGEAMPKFEVKYEGFKNQETESVLTKKPVVSTEATVSSAPGEYVITVSGAEAQNYGISYVNGKLTVTEADLVVIKAKSYTIKYGDAIPTFEYDVEGKLEGTPKLTCEATSKSSVGTYPIKVSKGSVTSYNVTYVDGTLTIEKAPLKVSVGEYTKRQGEPMPEFVVKYETFRNNDNESVLTKKPVVKTNATEASAPGEYEVTVSGAEAKNYEFSYEKGKLVVTEALPITLTAKSYTIQYGDAIPTFEFETEGEPLKGTPAITCEATSQSPVGTYPIVISKGTVGNYNATYVNGTLTIEKAPLTVKVGNYTKKQGEPMPVFELTYEGFKNDESESVLTEKPVAVTEADEASEPGTYPIVVTGGEAQNYNITRVNGVLTVVEADRVLITAKSYTITYGDKLPSAFEYTVSGAELSGEPVITCDVPEDAPAGTYPIVVSMGTVDNYNVVLVNGTLTINKAVLTVICGNYTKKQGDPMPNYKPYYTGWKKGENESVLDALCYVTTEATETSEPGEYELVLNPGSAKNYTFKCKNGKLTVTEAPLLTLTANSYTITYGSELPEFSFVALGDNVKGEPSITCEATSQSPVGTYPIVISQGTVTNFRVEYVNGTLTIEKAPLTVSVGDYEMEQGEAIPDFVLTYDGFKNNDDESVLLVKPVATTAATTESTPGLYDIIVSGGEAQNYSFVYVNGTLTVKERSDIAAILGDCKVFDIYSANGVKVRSQASSFDGLPAGLYIVNGKKVFVRK